VLDGAREAVARIDLRRHEGVHPRVGAVDVAPIVYLDEAQRGAACAEALILADMLEHELDLPVHLYGALAGGRTRAELRRPGAIERLHLTAGATLVAARPPLAAFNVELAPPATLEQAKAIAAELRRLPGVTALGLRLGHAIQVSTNLEDLEATTPGDIVRAVARRAPVQAAELVAPAPRAAFESFPPEIPLRAAPLLG
jgi:glutamate formiminotransferase / 5-formyltetrahydrofolate cyclo-ligase